MPWILAVSAAYTRSLKECKLVGDSREPRYLALTVVIIFCNVLRIITVHSFVFATMNECISLMTF
jgi:hypothetical protein